MRRVLPWLLAGLGGILVVTGLAVFLGSAAPVTVVYGGGYAPLEPKDLGPYQSELTLAFDGAVGWTSGRLVGSGLAVLGLLVLAGVAGWAIGVRSREGLG